MQKAFFNDLKKKAIRWLFCFAVVAGFMFYKSAAPMETIVIAGVATFALLLATTYINVSRTYRE